MWLAFSNLYRCLGRGLFGLLNLIFKYRWIFKKRNTHPSPLRFPALFEKTRCPNHYPWIKEDHVIIFWFCKTIQTVNSVKWTSSVGARDGCGDLCSTTPAPPYRNFGIWKSQISVLLFLRRTEFKYVHKEIYKFNWTLFYIVPKAFFWCINLLQTKTGSLPIKRQLRTHTHDCLC